MHDFSKYGTEELIGFLKAYRFIQEAITFNMAETGKPSKDELLYTGLLMGHVLDAITENIRKEVQP